MSGNTFGNIFRINTFGESHGSALGVIIDGCPAGLLLDENVIQKELDRRRPGEPGNPAATPRFEPDKAEILSGVFNGTTTGTPIAILIKNTSQHSKDYTDISEKFRPGHADFSYFEKYGLRDYRGGGRSSGRETAARVAAGAVAKAFLREKGIFIKAWTEEAAGIKCGTYDESEIDNNSMKAPDKEAAGRMLESIDKLRMDGDSAGGIVAARIHGKIPAGLGEPVFDKLDALLGQAVLSIGAVKGIEFGAGFETARMKGSESNDPLSTGSEGEILFGKNNAGGILGGISSGAEIRFRVAVKPVPSIRKVQKTINTAKKEAEIAVHGRHDVCLCPRIVPVVEAMAALVITDLYLRNLASRI